MVNENGAGLVKTELGPGMMTIFPKGSLHSMQNNGMFSFSYDLSVICFSPLLSYIVVVYLPSFTRTIYSSL